MWLFDNEEMEENDTYKVNYDQYWLKFITYVYFNWGFEIPAEELDLVAFYPFCPLNPKDKTLLLLWKDIYWIEVLWKMVDIYMKNWSSLSIEYLLGENIDDTIFAKIKNPFSSEVLACMRNELESFYFWSPVQDKDMRAVKHLMHSIFEIYYKMYWLAFSLDIHKIARIFENNDLLHILVRLYLAGFIHFDGYWFEVIRKGYVSLQLDIAINPALEGIFNANISNKDLLIETIFSNMYTKFSITKKNGEINLLERDIQFSWDSVKFVELQRQYPHSEIKAKNYEWKISKYEVKEKIKLNKNEQE